MTKPIVTACLVLSLGGCFNETESSSVTLGVSIGQQLIDLKAAYEQDAIDEDEYEDAKEAILESAEMCLDD